MGRSTSTWRLGGALTLGLLLLLLLLLFLSVHSPPLGAAPAPDDAGAAAEARRIAGTLRCPVCEGLSVADSPSALAEEMRLLIFKKVVAGETAEAIVAYFVDRYGEEVSLVPRRRGIGHTLWWGPVAIFGCGAAAVGATLWRWRRSGASHGSGPSGHLAPPLSREEERAYQDLLRGDAPAGRKPASGPPARRKQGPGVPVGGAGR